MTMKKTLMTSVLVLSGLLAVPVAALAAEGGASKDDAVAMVKKGVARIKSGGAETAYAEFNDKANQTYRDRDLYLVVYGLDGVVLSHGANAKMIGKNLIDLKDIDGKAFVRERVEMGKKNASFWQDYKFTNPENKKIEPKSMYCERLNESVVCGGIYK
ncbi:cache domain-containing protein [Aquabacterium sp.]|jgi:cytochrome c|uniref:cache domain-containing protein n=1 Tax=Aquabacterium sp. TaxID=1872578 RepID=UPI0025C6A43D|nr:cache domain-containing protein [Aquabacterium sp.]MDQ5927247.1 cytochrome c [Pseudomonadota bacterium]